MAQILLWLLSIADAWQGGPFWKTHTSTPTLVCVLVQVQQHFPKGFFYITKCALISLRRGLEDNQHETLAHVARGCYAACKRASPNGAIILNSSIITAASSHFLPFSPFLMMQQEISKMH